MPTLVEAPATNDFSHMRISEINRAGTDALLTCAQQEFEGRDQWADPELRSALDISREFHDGERRKDGPYFNHILRVALWAVREFNTRNPEISKAALLHDTFENHPERVITTFGKNKQLQGSTLRERALDAFRQSGVINNPRTVDALGFLTCPSWEGLKGRRKWQAYGRFVANVTLQDPLAAVVKKADQIDNSVGNHHNPDPALRRRLDCKYFSAFPVFLKSVTAKGSLVPPESRAKVIATFEKGHEATLGRLQTAIPEANIPALSQEEISSLQQLV